jgi:hypothetical protein
MNPITYRSLSAIKRRASGHTLAELGPTLLIVFMIFTFPLASMATMGVRYMFLMNAAKQTADAASQCKYWSLNSKSVLPTVNAEAAQCIAAFSGLTMVGTPTIQVYQGVPPTYAPTALNMASLPLANANNTAIYTIKVTINAKLKPLIQAGTFVVSAPGLNAPLSTSASAEVVLESSTAVTNQ